MTPANFPRFVDRYEILLPLASGGMATVYLARLSAAGGFEREVALKLTHEHLKQDPAFAQDVLEEAKLAARIRHPNVVQTLDVGDSPAGVYLVMEYLEGDSLWSLWSNRRKQGHDRLAAPVVARILGDMLAGLHAAHELRDAGGNSIGLVHRDVSPHNVFVGVDGVTKLVDFGIAKAATRLSVTATGMIKGKASYMSPEQALGMPLDRRCDVWAAGVIAWELLSDQRLFPSSDASSLVRIVSEDAPPLSSVVDGVSPRLEGVIARALSREVDSRYQTAADFRADLLAAFREQGPIAELEEVSALVRQSVSAKLEKRRAELRERLSSAGAAAPPPAPSAPEPAENTNHSKAIDAVSSPVEAPPGRRQGAILAAAILGALLLGAGATSLSSLGRPGPATASSGLAEPSAPAPSAAAAPSAPALPPQARREVSVSSNLPFVSLSLNGRTMQLSRPTTQATLPLLESESAAPLTLEIRGADRRRLSAQVAPDQSSVAISFPVAAAKSSKPPELAPSPYGPK